MYSILVFYDGETKVSNHGGPYTDWNLAEKERWRLQQTLVPGQSTRVVKNQPLMPIFCDQCGRGIFDHEYGCPQFTGP